MDKPRKKLAVFTLKASAHAFYTEGQCNLGQRNGLSHNDIIDIASLYGSTCGYSIIKPLPYMKLIYI